MEEVIEWLYKAFGDLGNETLDLYILQMLVGASFETCKIIVNSDSKKNFIPISGLRHSKLGWQAQAYVLIVKS